MNLRVGIVSAGRNDWGIYWPVARALRETPGFAPVIIATGTHMDARFGQTVRDLAAAGFDPDECIPLVPENDGPADVSRAMGEGLVAFSNLFERVALDVLLLLGDRFEMFAAAAAAVPFQLPLAHLHGGEVTEGAIDEQFRHAISKLSHLHFVSTERYRQRLLQMGEEPWRVCVSGAPGLDHLSRFVPWSRDRLAKALEMDFDRPPLVVTFHPVTLRAAESIDPLLVALQSFADWPIVLTGPNSDPGYSHIVARLESFVASVPNAKLVSSLGTERYFSLLSAAAAMVGNSSSGLIEAASFGLPVVNIGDRQKGRVRGANVLDVPCCAAEIECAIMTALSEPFRQSLAGMNNPYGHGGAARRILDALATSAARPDLLSKKFVDYQPRDATR